MEETNPFVELLKRDRRFKAESYRFINEALHYAQNVLKLGRADDSSSATDSDNSGESSDASSEERHVTGQDLSRAVTDYAVHQYGYMARPVLRDLGICKTDDIGRIVYNLIEIGMMRKTDEDSLEDFFDVFPLGEELDKNFSFQKK